MVGYVLKRILLIIPTLLGITLVTFVIIHLAPGDPAELKMQAASEGIESEALSKEIIEQTRKLYGLDKPLHEQYFIWIEQLVTLDFGNSYKDQRPVSDKIAESLPITLLLNLITIFIAYVVSVPLGAWSSVRQGKLSDRLVTLVLFILYSLPSFWIALLLINYLAGGDYLDLFPIGGISSDGSEMLSWFGRRMDNAWHLVLPVLALTYGSFAFLSRFSRANLLEVVRQDYIRTARAKGLAERVVIFRHAFRNSLIPIITVMGTLLPALLGGSVIIEQIFSIPGMGRLGFEAILSRDYPVVMAIASISAFLTLVSILISDILYVFVDPRVSFEAVESR